MRAVLCRCRLVTRLLRVAVVAPCLSRAALEASAAALSCRRALALPAAVVRYPSLAALCEWPAAREVHRLVAH